MALYDDRRFLLSHIHHSFVTSDDTGMCEMALLSEVTDHQDGPPELRVHLERRSDQLEPPEPSYDLVSGMGFMGGHRHRSNTAQRLEKLKKDRQMQGKIQRIWWKECLEELTEKDLCDLFPKKDLSKQKEIKETVKSALSEALELFPAAPNNPFSDYARFDGRVNRSAPSKKILIYLTMQSEEERNYAMEVICLSSAKVQELIGLICWMYTNDEKEPKLNESVSNYCLKIAEETGEVDEDFPSLDANELVGKFGFPHLALIEKEIKKSIPVTMYIEDEVVKLNVPTLDISLQETADLASQKVPVENSNAYHIEKPDEPGVSIPLDSKLSNFSNLVFQLIFESGTSGSTEEGKRKFSKKRGFDALYSNHMKAVEAPLYRSFHVTLYQKMGINYDVQLGISGEKVEINPLPQKGAAKILSRQQKAATLYMDIIGACEIISKTSSAGRCTFKLVYQIGQEFKKYVFETYLSNAQDIVRKVELILEMHSSNAYKEYQAYRERKLLKKFQGSSSKQQ